jgi:hypothetical protein
MANGSQFDRSQQLREQIALATAAGNAKRDPSPGVNLGQRITSSIASRLDPDAARQLLGLTFQENLLSPGAPRDRLAVRDMIREISGQAGERDALATEAQRLQLDQLRQQLEQSRSPSIARAGGAVGATDPGAAFRSASSSVANAQRDAQNQQRAAIASALSDRRGAERQSRDDRLLDEKRRRDFLRTLLSGL